MKQPSIALRDQYRRGDYKKHGHRTYPTAVPCSCGCWRRWVDDLTCVRCHPRRGKAPKLDPKKGSTKC